MGGSGLRSGSRKILGQKCSLLLLLLMAICGIPTENGDGNHPHNPRQKSHTGLDSTACPTARADMDKLMPELRILMQAELCMQQVASTGSRPDFGSAAAHGLLLALHPEARSITASSRSAVAEAAIAAGRIVMRAGGGRPAGKRR